MKTRKMAERRGPLVTTSRTTQAQGTGNPAASNNQIQAQAPAPASRGNSAEAEPDDDDDEGEWQCICGKTGYGDDGAATECIACTKWQHNRCLFLPVYDEDIKHDHYICHQCLEEVEPGQHEFAAYVSAADRGERPWEHNGRKFDIVSLLVQPKLDWFWRLRVRLTAENVTAMKTGRRLSGIVTPKKAPEEYRTEAEKSVRVLLNRMNENDVRVLHGRVSVADVTPSRAYNALLEQAEQQKQLGWESCNEDLGVLAELFGW